MMSSVQHDAGVCMASSVQHQGLVWRVLLQRQGCKTDLKRGDDDVTSFHTAAEDIYLAIKEQNNYIRSGPRPACIVHGAHYFKDRRDSRPRLHSAWCSLLQRQGKQPRLYTASLDSRLFMNPCNCM